MTRHVRDSRITWPKSRRADSLPPHRLQPAPTAEPSTRFGFTVFCLAVFSLAFMGTSVAMYYHFFGFNQRQIQLWIAWTSMGLGGLSAVLSPLALSFRRGIYEISAMIGAFLYWIVFILLLRL
jgi:hypothetical protein